MQSWRRRAKAWVSAPGLLDTHGRQLGGTEAINLIIEKSAAATMDLITVRADIRRRRRTTAVSRGMRHRR
jgi:hypothetical protein